MEEDECHSVLCQLARRGEEALEEWLDHVAKHLGGSNKEDVMSSI
jgi:hypothetical protein